MRASWREAVAGLFAAGLPHAPRGLSEADDATGWSR